MDEGQLRAAHTTRRLFTDANILGPMIRLSSLPLRLLALGTCATAARASAWRTRRV
jgi:hypothetical protein